MHSPAVAVNDQQIYESGWILMHLLKKLSLISSLLATLTIPAMAGVTIISPVHNTDVSSPFTVNADASTCSSQPVVAMGFSLDGGGDIAIVNATTMQHQATAGSGGHTLHVKAWGNNGAVCVTDAYFTVTSGGTSDAVPSGASSVSHLEDLSNWKALHDAGTPGTASGSTGMVASPSRTGRTRRLSTSYTNYGGERYNVSFGDDKAAHNFVYDVWLYITAGSGIKNLEMDLNQVMSNGQTVIYGFQCDGWSGTWDFTANRGSPTKYSDRWVHSGAHCNPGAWSRNTWHHVQIAYSRNDSGVVTYKYVILDGAKSTINATVPSSFALHWGPTLLVNLQMDGLGGKGGSTVYLDSLTVYRW